MDGSTTKRTDVDVLKTLIAGLLSLGQMAERIVDRSSPVRVLILWILGRSESLAWRHIPDDVMSPFIVHHRYSRVHAQHFAWLFKTASYWLKRKMRQKERFARKWAKWEARKVTESNPPEGRIGGLLQSTCETLRKLRDLFSLPAPRLDSS